ncbi:S-methyl-5'-thioadenosine phosphorylase [Ralstonia sp. SET104]|uniref:S-methyl-5'-thioadenosine phosphorylase n=1 Tax=Ralstonia sp. SET104 TaxID=2448774 RepID=UPI000FF9BAFA|nr:S-methyl-5'-thioadenosine phosphorylase [Ralstonia sp. SET104]GCB05248.1 S-methyl-5'-thioadenosine phosphorylase [Ralstonia sp. SET104]
MSDIRIGIIGGSGLYQMEGIEQVQEHEVATPYGAPSDRIVTGVLHGAPVAFLARHGRGHRYLPGEVPYRANIYALKAFGVRYLIAISAVGSLQESVRPLDMVLPDQFIDLTRRRESTFFGNGAVAHVSMAQPVCPVFADMIAQAFLDAGLEGTNLHRGGTYVCIEGPAFSTYAESQWYRNIGGSVIGMTNMPEAKLAREAEMAYATLALVTDYDCWHPREAPVTAELAIANLLQNAANAQRVVSQAVRLVARDWPPSQAHRALAAGLVTQPATMDQATRARLDTLIRDYL